MSQDAETSRQRKILVGYTTNAGSTEEVAQAVAEGLCAPGSGTGLPPVVEVRRIEDITSLEGYDAVVIGAPMILGWSRAAVNFVRRHREALAGKKTAYFATMMALTAGQPQPQVNLFVDPYLPTEPKHPGRLGIKERYATPQNYLRPILGAAPQVKPVSVAFFGGKLELFRLKWYQMLFVMAVIGAAPGDRRDFESIKAWGESLLAVL